MALKFQTTLSEHLPFGRIFAWILHGLCVTGKLRKNEAKKKYKKSSVFHVKLMEIFHYIHIENKCRQSKPL